MLLILAVSACVIFGPGLWVSYVLKKYNREPESNFPGTGGELARHLLDRYNLQDVKVVVTETGDHYSPEDRSVALTKDKFNGKTLASIVIAAHECGHAIQHANGQRRCAIRCDGIYAPAACRVRSRPVARYSGTISIVLQPMFAQASRP